VYAACGHEDKARDLYRAGMTAQMLKMMILCCVFTRDVTWLCHLCCFITVGDWRATLAMSFKLGVTGGDALYSLARDLAGHMAQVLHNYTAAAQIVTEYCQDAEQVCVGCLVMR